MKGLIVGLIVCSAITSCTNKQQIIDPVYLDSLLVNYQEPAAVKANTAEINFWKNRIDPASPGIVNESKYAAALIGRFHLKGDINDVNISDSMLQKIDTLYNHKEASACLSLAVHALLQHRFKQADAYLAKAQAIGLKPYELHATAFDVNFESGFYAQALRELNAIKRENDFGYQFRQSKWEHFKGNIDSAIDAMQQAVALSGSNISLKQAALSNTADLYVHDGQLGEARDLYMQSIQLDHSDLHSIMGLGWIALVHDKKDTLAEKVFLFVNKQTTSPDPLFKLMQVAESRRDTLLQKEYAMQFATKVTGPLYGNMYNKYLVDIYTGILNDPAKAAAIAKKELENRATPQTYAWYAYALFRNNKVDEAQKIYRQFVSGKPLEGLELYWIGKMMQGIKQGFNAEQYLKEAYKNKYDLSPAKVMDLESIPGVK